MWNEDDLPPQQRYELPKSVRRAHLASRRPRMGHWFTAAAAVAGGLVAGFITIALTSGMCFDGAANCGAIGQPTVIFGLFTVPLGFAAGAVLGGNQVDRAVNSYRPEM